MSDKKYTLITGATSGIGYELAKLFVRDKHNLVIVARDQERLSAKASEFRQSGIEVIAIAKDLSRLEQSYELVRELEIKNIRIEILVNNAGQGVYGLFKDNDIERELAIVDLNIGATIVLTKYVVKEMIQMKQGKILNLASIASTVPGPWQAVYHGTKAFVLSFSEALRSELEDTGVTVTALLPGVTDTDFFNKAGMQESKAVQDASDMADPADVARDGYQALMAGKDKVVSGFKNKVQVTMGSLLPDSVLANQMKSQQEPVDDNDGN